jgi:hypothetical protein
MGLRDRLKQSLQPELHVASPRECNSATPTTNPQPVMQPECNSQQSTPGVDQLHSPIADATIVQLGSCTAPDSATALATAPRTELHPVIHIQTWRSAEESAAIGTRLAVLARRGVRSATATDIATRLLQRDRDQDDRQMCFECTYLSDSGRCLAASAGRISGASHRLEPVPDMLQRCSAFGLKKGLI